MENQLAAFGFGDQLVRTITEEEQIYFIGKDIALALEYSNSSISQLANLFKIIPEEWVGIKPIKTNVGIREVLTLSEQGLYFFLARSDKPKALPFQKWLAGEVLPSLRRTGAYSVPRSQSLSSLPEVPALAFSLRPAMRERLWQDALQCARLDNGTTADAMNWFEFLCSMMGAEGGCRNAQLRRFAGHFYSQRPDERVRASELYAKYGDWCFSGGEQMLNQTLFGRQMGDFFPKQRRNGHIFYRTCSVDANSAENSAESREVNHE